jgi:hypothetical protein
VRIAFREIQTGVDPGNQRKLAPDSDPGNGIGFQELDSGSPGSSGNPRNINKGRKIPEIEDKNQNPVFESRSTVWNRIVPIPMFGMYRFLFGKHRIPIADVLREEFQNLENDADDRGSRPVFFSSANRN